MDKFIVEDWFPIQEITHFQDLEILEEDWITVPNIIDSVITDQDCVSIPEPPVSVNPQVIIEKDWVHIFKSECQVAPVHASVSETVLQTCEIIHKHDTWEVVHKHEPKPILEYVKISLLFSLGVLILMYPFIINWLIIHIVGIIIIAISGFLMFVSEPIPSSDNNDDIRKIIKFHGVEVMKEIIIKKVVRKPFI